MNYIKRLQEENEALRSALEMTQAELTDLLAYVNSDKFRDDRYVNVADIQCRVINARILTVV